MATMPSVWEETHYALSYNEETVSQAVENYKLTVNAGSSNLGKVYYSVRLNSETAVTLYLNVKNRASLTASTTFNGKTFHAVRLSDGSYRLDIEGINASQLADTITVTGDAGGSFTIQISVLAYVRNLLRSSKYANNRKAKDSVMALYYYYQKTMAYRSSRSG